MKDSNSEEYRRWLVKMVKVLAQDVYDMAPDLVGNSDLISNFEIRLKFEPDKCPNIELVREHISKNGLQVLWRPKYEHQYNEARD